MAQTVVMLIHQQHTQIIASICLQSAGNEIGLVAQFVRNGTDPLSGLFADIFLSVQGFTDRSNGNTALFCNIFHGNHSKPLLYKMIIVWHPIMILTNNIQLLLKSQDAFSTFFLFKQPIREGLDILSL